MPLSMSQKSRQEVLERALQRYGRRNRQGRSRLLDERCVLCADTSASTRSRCSVAGAAFAVAAVVVAGARCRFMVSRSARCSGRSGWRPSNPVASAWWRRCRCGCPITRSATASWSPRCGGVCIGPVRRPSTGCWPRAVPSSEGVAVAARAQARCCAARSRCAPSTGKLRVPAISRPTRWPTAGSRWPGSSAGA